MEALTPPEGLTITGNSNLCQHWKKFKQRFELFCTAAGYDGKTEKVKTSLLLHIIGEEGLDLYNTFTFEGTDNQRIVPVMAKFDEHFNPRKNETMERYRFFTCVPNPGESIDIFITELKNKSQTCEFGDLKNSLIRDRIVCAIYDNKLRERLLRESDLTLDRCIEMCRSTESTKKSLQEMSETKGKNTGSDSGIGTVDAVKRNSNIASGYSSMGNNFNSNKSAGNKNSSRYSWNNNKAGSTNRLSASNSQNFQSKRSDSQTVFDCPKCGYDHPRM